MQASSITAKKKLGAHYTPISVVQFLLRHSLQQQIDLIVQKAKEAGKKKNHLGISNAIERLSEIRVLDPACGDGIFLVEALRLIEEGYEKIRSICQREGLRLADLREQAQCTITTAIGPKIALKNLYGVDIDAAAVKKTIERFQSYFTSKRLENSHYRARLPLANFEDALRLNIKVGNALKIPLLDWISKSEGARSWVETFAFRREQIREKVFLHIHEGDSRFDESLLKHKLSELHSSVLKKFNFIAEQMVLERPETRSIDLNDLFIWELIFPEVFTRRNQGFDVICGNPPYINLEMIRNSDLNRFLQTGDRWCDLYRGKGDVQYHFLMLALQLLRSKGHLAMITSRYWLENKNADILRKQLIKQARVIRLLDLGETALFDAGIHNLLIILEKSRISPHYSFEFARIEELSHHALELLLKENQVNWMKIPAQRVFTSDDGPWQLLSGEISELLTRIESILKQEKQLGFRLDEVAHIGEGIKTGNDAVFASFEHLGDGYYKNRLDEEERQYQFEEGLIRPVITSSKEVIPFHIAPRKTFLLCTHKIGDSINQYPVAKSYLKRFIESLDKLRGVNSNSRPLGKRYAVVAEKKTPYDIVRYNENLFGPWHSKEKKFKYPRDGIIFGRYRNKTACFALSENALCCLTNTVAISSKNLYGCSMRYLLALLNSQAIDFFIRFGKRKKKGTVQEYRRSTLRDVPIRVLNLQNPDEKRIHDTIVTKAIFLEEKQQAILQGDSRNEDLQKQYKETKNELNQLISQLYNLESLSDRITRHLVISA